MLLPIFSPIMRAISALKSKDLFYGALGIDGQINVGIVGSVDGHREIAAKLSAAARPINLPVVGDGEEGRLLAATA